MDEKPSGHDSFPTQADSSVVTGSERPERRFAVAAGATAVTPACVGPGDKGHSWFSNKPWWPASIGDDGAWPD